MMHVHIFTDASEISLLKQFPGCSAEGFGYRFSVGLDIPERCDALIIWNRSEISIEPQLPKCRTAFIMAEPEVVRPISCKFFNQFGFVISQTNKDITVPHKVRTPCWPWYAGVDFSNPNSKETTKGYDFFKNYAAEPKVAKLSIVTSGRTSLPQHIKRLRFIEKLSELIPQHIEFFGRDSNPVDDKFEALAPFKYHLALENSVDKNSWTEKLADPLLCWTHPFYVGCPNAQDYLPSGSFTALDIDKPDEAASIISSAIENQLWEKQLSEMKKAREILLEKHNASRVILNTARALTCAIPPDDDLGPTKIQSDKSMFAEKKTITDWLSAAILKVILTIDPEAELKFWKRKTTR